MMRRLPLWLVILTACIAGSACASRRAPEPVRVTQRAERCAPVPRAGLELLDETRHLGSAANLEVMARNTRALMDEIEALRAAVRCHEAQAPEAEP
ncbi:MAG: hypothetical protein AB7D57_15235 [Desulfovibrionaceae bacterium]